ncbi:MAG: hypothetical protein R2789_16780 [Microthrixaceae bacterium]
MYLADTLSGIVDVFDLDPISGEIGGRRRFLDLSCRGSVARWNDNRRRGCSVALAGRGGASI